MYFNQKGTGEGVVWTEWLQSFGILSFKVKGQEHSVTKSRQIASISTEIFANIQDFIEYACTENRMHQSLDYLREIQLDVEIDNIETFLEWLVIDIKKEETNTIKNSNLNQKEVVSTIISKATDWFEKQLTKNNVQIKFLSQKLSHFLTFIDHMSNIYVSNENSHQIMRRSPGAREGTPIVGEIQSGSGPTRLII
ncbi:unnamed protein product [Adineta steineri]|uniref:Uncharacterized protein n=2 Tax=Adineta steineri TaxID=433720 RepID=A0A815K612_9BILA|nr:unnamed protein product [Adineta steineri]